MKKENLKVAKIIIIICIVLVTLILMMAIGGTIMKELVQRLADSYNNESSENIVQNIIEEENVVEKVAESDKSKYKDYTSWYANDIHTYYERDWTPMKYILVRVETEDGDLQEGNYIFETNNEGATFLVYVVDKPIDDLGTYEGEYHLVMKGVEDIKETYTTELKKGQYVYVVQGYAKKGSIYIKKLDTNN